MYSFGGQCRLPVSGLVPVIVTVGLTLIEGKHEIKCQQTILHNLGVKSDITDKNFWGKGL